MLAVVCREEACVLNFFISSSIEVFWCYRKKNLTIIFCIQLSLKCRAPEVSSFVFQAVEAILKNWALSFTPCQLFDDHHPSCIEAGHKNAVCACFCSFSNLQSMDQMMKIDFMLLLPSLLFKPFVPTWTTEGLNCFLLSWVCWWLSPLFMVDSVLSL